MVSPKKLFKFGKIISANVSIWKIINATTSKGLEIKDILSQNEAAFQS